GRRRLLRTADGASGQAVARYRLPRIFRREKGPALPPSPYFVIPQCPQARMRCATDRSSPVEVLPDTRKRATSVLSRVASSLSETEAAVVSSTIAAFCWVTWAM